MLLLLVAFLCVAGAQQTTAPAPAQTTDPDMLLIDGKKNPEMIPQWQMWESALDFIAAAQKAGGVVLDEELQFSDDDMALLYAEAAAQQERWNAHKKKVFTELEPLLAKMKREDVLPMNRAMILEYRRQVLDGSQRLLQRLSPEARVALPRWVEQRKAFITLTIHKSELDFHRRPY